MGCCFPCSRLQIWFGDLCEIKTLYNTIWYKSNIFIPIGVMFTYMETKTIFVERLQELVKIQCKEKRATVNKIAHDMGMNQPTLHRYLSGEREPNISSLALIARYFNVSADWLLGLKEYEQE